MIGRFFHALVLFVIDAPLQALSAFLATVGLLILGTIGLWATFTFLAWWAALIVVAFALLTLSVIVNGL